MVQTLRGDPLSAFTRFLYVKMHKQAVRSSSCAQRCTCTNAHILAGKGKRKCRHTHTRTQPTNMHSGNVMHTLKEKLYGSSNITPFPHLHKHTRTHKRMHAYIPNVQNYSNEHFLSKCVTQAGPIMLTASFQDQDPIFCRTRWSLPKEE